MLSRKIIIKNCLECPHRDHRGAFAKIACVPYCMKRPDKDLPHTVQKDGARIQACLIVNELPPRWCPLALN